MEPEAVEGKSLAKVRWPGVSTVTLGEKGAAGPEVGAGPVVTTVPLLRMSASWVRGEFLSVVGAEGPERKERQTELRALVLGAGLSSSPLLDFRSRILLG